MAFLAGQKLRASELNPGAWQVLSLTNGWAPRAGYYVPSYRLDGDEVELVGGLINGTATNGTVVGTLASGFWPAADQPLPCLANNGNMYGVFIRTNGDIELFHSEGASPTFTAVYLMGSFPLSV